jgi:hypothetical protein
MSCTARTPFCLSALKRAVPLGLACVAVLASRQGGAQQQPSLPANLLPPVPTFQLSLPALPVPSNHWLWLQQEGSPAAADWKAALVPREWRDARDDELRLELETGHWDLGKLSLSSELSTVPGRERDCEAACRGASWSSALRLKFNAGDLGPLRQTGPELKVGFTPARPGTKPQGLLRGGFGGKF